MSFSFANTEYGSTANTKLSPTDVNDFSEKPKQEKRKDNDKTKSNNNYHDIISTTRVIALLVAVQETIQ